MADSNMNIHVNLKDRASGSLNKMQGRFQNFVQKSKTDWVTLTAKIYLFIGAIRTASRVLDGFIGASDKVEQLQVRLKVLFGNVEEGGKLFAAMERLAGQVPKTYDEIMESATQLASVVKGGSQEVIDLMPIIVDLSAATGISVRDTTSQMIRMYSAGAASADMFRERGVLAMLGFKAGVSYEAEETMDRVVAAWEDAGSKFRGASDELAETWTGKVSMMQDAWFKFQKAVGDFFTDNEGANWFLDQITYAMNYWAKTIDESLNKDTGKILQESLQKVNQEIEKTRQKIGRQALTWKSQEELQKKINELYKKRALFIRAIHMEQDIEKQKAQNLGKIVIEKEKEQQGAIDETKDDAKEKFNAMEAFAEQAARNIQNAFSDFFFDAFKGELDSLSDILQSFGDAMLRTLANIAAQKAAIGVATAMGFPGFAVGTPYIPKTGLYKLHEGERVVPAHENNGSNGSGGGVTINVNQMISTMDASDFMRRRKMISDAVAVELQNNAGIRQAIQKYT